MKTKKFLCFLLMVMMAFAFISCSLPNDSESDVPPKADRLPPLDSENGVRLAFTAAPRILARSLSGSTPKIEFKTNELRGDIDFKATPISCTPSYFFLDLSCTKVYEANCPTDPEKGSRDHIDLSRRINGEAVNNVNMLSSKGMPTLPITREDFWTKPWNSFCISSVPWVGESNASTGVEPYITMSLVGVELPENINIEDVKNALRAEDIMRMYNVQLDPEIAWFNYSDLFPTKGTYLGYIVFQHGLPGPRIINAEGIEGERTIGGFGGYGNFGGICLPLSSDLDFSGYENPVIRIEYDTEDMVSLYPDADGTWTACLNMDDPFPFELKCEEYDPADDAYIDSNAAVSSIKNARAIGPLYARRSNGNIALQFIKPNYHDIHHMEIRHGLSDDISLSEVIYEGNENVFMHEGDFDADNHYWATTVDSYGRKSEPVPFLKSKKSDDGGGGQGPILNGKIYLTSKTSNKEIPASDAGNVFREHAEDKYKNYLVNEPDFRITPEYFLMEIDEMLFYKPTDSTNPVVGSERTHTYPIVDGEKDIVNIDLLHPGKPLELKTEDNGSDFRNPELTSAGMRINSVCHIEETGVSAGTVVGIPKSLIGNGFDFINDVPDRFMHRAVNPMLPENLADYYWFDLRNLIPTKGKFADRFLWQYGTEKGTYYNPDGTIGKQIVGCFEDFSTDRTCASIKPDFRIPREDPANDTLVLNVNPTDMIWVYRMDDGKYFAVLNLDNPFPIQLEITDGKTI